VIFICLIFFTIVGILVVLYIKYFRKSTTTATNLAWGTSVTDNSFAKLRHPATYRSNATMRQRSYRPNDEDEDDTEEEQYRRKKSKKMEV